MRVRVYRTWLGRFLLGLIPLAGLVGITMRLLFEWDGFGTTEAGGHLVGTALAALLSWRGLTAGIVVT